ASLVFDRNGFALFFTDCGAARGLTDCGAPRRPQPEELPTQGIYRHRKGTGRMDQLEGPGRKTYLLDQSPGVAEPLPCPQVALTVFAGPFGTGDEVDLVGACLKGLQEMERIDPPAAGQGKEADPRAQLLFQKAPVRVLIGIELSTEEDRYLDVVLVGLHNLPTHKKRTSGVDVLVFYDTPLC